MGAPGETHGGPKARKGTLSDGGGQDALWKPGDHVCDTCHISLVHAHKHWKGKDAVCLTLGNGTEPRAIPPRAIEREKMNGGIMDIRANSLGS